MNKPAQTKEEKTFIQENQEWLEEYDRQRREEGREEGLKDGREEGRKRWAGSLALQLEQRFGELPAQRRAQVDSADLGELSAWQGRVISAKYLDEVFGD